MARRAPADPDQRPAEWSVQLPKLRDPRLHVAGVLVTVQVLGQVSIGFDLSIAQILVAMGTAGLLEVLLTARRTRVIAWPASALLTGNGVALLLRVPGTEHGDWFSMRGWWVFAATAALAVLSKYVIRSGDRPLFNPSNFALVVTFLVLGAQFADPQDLWWGPMSVGLVVTYAVIIVGGVVITRRLHLLRVSISFWAVFGTLMAALALTGHSIAARWSLAPVAGLEYWTTVVLSPEILIFVFFMITDPRTAARGRTAGMLFGGLVAATSAVLVAFQSTEYATKVALLAGLVVVCAARPLIERLAPGIDEPPSDWLAADLRRPALLGVGTLAMAALVLVGAATVTADQPSVIGDATAAARPQVELRRDQRPSIEVIDTTAILGEPIDDATARRLTDEVVAALLVADAAVEQSDPAMAATVATGPYREDLAGRGPGPAPDRTITSAVVDVVRDPGDFQAVPRMSVELTGTEDGEPWSTTLHVWVTSTGAFLEREVPA